MWTILHDNIEKIGCFDNFKEPDNILVYEISMDLNLSFKHLQISSSEFFKLNDFDSIPFMSSFYLNSLINFT